LIGSQYDVAITAEREFEMSIDIWLTIDTGKEAVSVVDVGNYTHNCQPMWRFALKNGAGVEMSLCDFNGQQAQQAAEILEKAVQHMSDPAYLKAYIALNPANGWGKYETALEYLKGFYEACLEHPLCIICTSC
jgi:hypothetical protein